MATKRLFVLTFLGIICFAPVRCARILGVFHFAARSHYILGHSLMKGLASAGHDVTMISPYEDTKPPNNGRFRNIVLTGFVEDFEVMLKGFNLFNTSEHSAGGALDMISQMFSLIDNTFTHPNVEALLHSNEKFDVVIVEQFFNDAMKVFGNHFDAPLVVLSPIGPNPSVNRIVGNPSLPSYIPHPMTDFSPSRGFFERMMNFLAYVLDKLMDYLLLFPRHQDRARKYFPDTPELRDIYHNTSLILLNSHGSLNEPVPLVPNMIEIGGYHVNPPKKLPKDLQDYLDNAKEGVIYFSLGSNLKSKDLPSEKRGILLKAFSKLKQKVLWKWEDDVLPGQPPNVKLGKWLPQQDILAHPNVKLFITHGGLLSTIETVYHGVPILAIPVFADQYSNAENAVRNGYALSLPYEDPNFSEERLSELLNELLSNPSYSENSKRRSQIFHDRPLKPMDAAIYWVEYVIRHRGAPHLRVAGAGMPIYKYYLLDVLAFLGIVTISVLVLLGLVIRCFLRRRKRTTKVQKVKTN